MSILPKETIQVIAQSMGINNLSDDVAAALAPDVEYRMREIMQEAIKCMLHSKRTVLTTDDVNSALQLRNIEPLYGFASGGPLRFKRVLGHADLFYVDDAELDLKEVIEAPLPKVPLDTTVVAHWLAIEGVQPAIPENVSTEAFGVLPESGKIEEQPLKRKDGESTVDIKLPVKHVLSRELQLYFEKITELIITGADSVLFKDALASLSTDSGIHPLVPYFTQFIADEVTRSLDDFCLLFSLMRVVRSLLLNPHIHIEPYLHQLMPSVITCLVARRLGNKFIENHWQLRDYSANLVAFICKRFGHAYHSLQSRLTRTLIHAFLDPKRAMTQHYGAIRGLAALGSRVVRLLILPNLEPYFQLLLPEMSFESQKNEMKRYEAWRVYDALLNCAGICMHESLKDFPTLFPACIWGLNSAGKVSISQKLGEDNFRRMTEHMPGAPSLTHLASPSRKRMDAENLQGLQKKQMTESLEMNGRSETVFHSSGATGEVHAGLVDKPVGQNMGDSSHEVGKREKGHGPRSDKPSMALAEAWKEDADTGLLLASLIDIFGEGMLSFVPQCELFMFI
eukprot:c26810_g1_i3 orf=285-1982(+)